MNFWKKLFKIKKIVSVEILECIEGISEDNKRDNLIVGHMEGGFDGMVVADVYNSNHSARTVFNVNYDDGTSKIITVLNSDLNYAYYMSFVNKKPR